MGGSTTTGGKSATGGNGALGGASAAGGNSANGGFSSNGRLNREYWRSQWREHRTVRVGQCVRRRANDHCELRSWLEVSSRRRHRCAGHDFRRFGVDVLSMFRMTGASRWRSTKARAAGAGGGYLDGGTGGTERPSRCPPRARDRGSSSSSTASTWTAPCTSTARRSGARPYGFFSFECDFTSGAKFGGSNVLAVRLNNQQPSSRWYSGSGIYRHTWLKTVNPVRVAYTGTRS